MGKEDLLDMEKKEHEENAVVGEGADKEDALMSSSVTLAACRPKAPIWN